MRLEYIIELEGGFRLGGSEDFSGSCLRLRPTLPEGRIKSVTAQMNISMAEDERFFVNGYQTWTYCPEQGKHDYTRGMGRLPKFVIDKFGIDRYGDYFFVDYPQTPGVMHGESYCYFRRGGRYRLLASLNERPGYTLLRYDSRCGVLTVTRDCAGLCCGGEFAALELYYAEGSEDEVFDGWFAAMGLKNRGAARLCGYSSWYNRYQNIDEKSIMGDLRGCAEHMKRGDLFQIDDGWETAVGDWLRPDEEKFPGGLEPIVSDIHERGFLAGLWLAPFVCQKNSRIFREHPDWLLMHEGKPWYCGSNWGGFYALDIDNPGFLRYLEDVFDRVLNVWGFELVKLDFLYAAAPFGNEHESRAGRMTRAMELLRRLCGDKLILGCGVPLMPSFGLVDYCRISCDVGLDWANNFIMRRTNREYVSTRHAIGNTVSRRQLNGRAFGNDPDVFFLREKNIRLSRDEKYKLAVVNSLFGALLLTSDNMGEYGEEAAELYERLRELDRAENVRVETEKGLTVYYELDGIEQVLEIE